MKNVAPAKAIVSACNVVRQIFPDIRIHTFGLITCWLQLTIVEFRPLTANAATRRRSGEFISNYDGNSLSIQWLFIVMFTVLQYCINANRGIQGIGGFHLRQSRIWKDIRCRKQLWVWHYIHLVLKSTYILF